MSTTTTFVGQSHDPPTSKGTAVELTESSGRALKLQTDSPHLVSLGGGRLSTAVTLHPIPQGRITLGSCPGADVTVNGTGVEPLHCQIENSGGVVTLYPLADNVSIDGVKVIEPTRLFQGVMLTIGRSNYMRFNHPAEAQLMKSALPTDARISMAPIKFNCSPETSDRTNDDDDHESIKYSVIKKIPPATPRRNSRDSDSPDDRRPPSNIQTKVSKFEYLAAQNFRQSISPKVFSSNLVTVNTPARDVLGRAPPDLQDFAKNLPRPAAINYADTSVDPKNKTPDRQFFGRKSPQYVNVAIRNNNHHNNHVEAVNNRVLVYENGCAPKTAPKQLNTDAKLLNNNKTLNIKSSNVVRVVGTPSPSFNREQPQYFRSLTPNPAQRPSASLEKRSGSVGEISSDLRRDTEDAEVLRNQARANRVKEQEMEKAEQLRLEEILSMCAEYERQAQWERNNKPIPNRIITNGSLPRDKRQCPPSPYNTPSPVSAKDNVSFRFDLEKPQTPDAGVVSSSNSYENVQTTVQQQAYPQSPRTRIRTVVTAKEPGADQPMASRECNYDDALARKPTPTKLMPASFESLRDERHEADRRRLERLRHLRRDARGKIAEAKRRIAEIRMQEEERYRAFDLEMCLIDAEHKSKSTQLEKMQQLAPKLADRARQIEHDMVATQSSQSEHQETCRTRLEAAESDVVRLEDLLSEASKGSAEHRDLFEEFLHAQEALDNERKTFEDLEFHHLETQADWLATREELQREMVDIERRSEQLGACLDDLDGQRTQAKEANLKEARLAEDKVLGEYRRLERLKEESKRIDAEIGSVGERESDPEVSSDSDDEKKNNDKMTPNYDLMSYSFVESRERSMDAEVYNMSQSFNEKMLFEKDVLEDCERGESRPRYPSQDDIDRICKVTSSSPMTIEDGQTSLSRKTIESLKEIEHNRHVHLAQQGSHVIEEERRRVLELKQRAQDEVMLEWAKRRQLQQQRGEDRASFESVGSNDISISGSDDAVHRSLTKEKIDCAGNEKLQTPLDFSDTSRPLSDTSDISAIETGAIPASISGKRRLGRSATLDKTRPLTRYLPIRDSELDLRQHVESAGHQVVLCPHVTIDSTSCRGYLHKRGSKLQGWPRRWFVFDRTRRSFVYYSDRGEKKPRGGAYFQVIEEVYMDHSNVCRSPNPQLTFIVKTHQRRYFLMAPSPEAMRIWMDVVFTGAEGYREFERDN